MLISKQSLLSTNNRNYKKYKELGYNFNLIIEIKSSYYFKLEESKNIYKKNASINSGYNFLFIIDKDYKELKKIINN